MKLSRTSSREAFMVEGLSPYVTVFLVYRGPHRPHLDHLRHIECILVLSTLILLTPFQYALNRWRHFVEGSEIHIRTDHESQRVSRTKCPMTKRLGKFMIEYRPGRPQVVPDVLSCIPGAHEDGDPADTDCFTLMALDEADDL